MTQEEQMLYESGMSGTRQNHEQKWIWPQVDKTQHSNIKLLAERKVCDVEGAYGVLAKIHEIRECHPWIQRAEINRDLQIIQIHIK